MNLKDGMMDPWTYRHIDDKVSMYRHQEVSKEELSIKSDNFNTFEDNFKPLVSDTLPDSKEYLAALETKLAKLKSDPNILQQLIAKRESCMRELLTSDSNSEVVVDSLDTPIENCTILRTIAPAKQALTEGEIVTLIQYDQLVNNESDQESKTELQ